MTCRTRAILLNMSGSEGIAWIVHTHEHKDRSTDWYWGLGVATAAGAGISLFLGNLLLAVIIIVAAASVGALVARGPRTHWVRVDGRGISMDGTLYRYDALHSFWVEPFDADTRGQGRLLVSTTSYVSPQLVIPTEEPSRAGALRSYLKKFIPEEEQTPHVGEHLAELLGL